MRKFTSHCRKVLVGLFVPFTVFGQASFELANLHTPLVDAPVFGADGLPLSGNNYLAELWGAATPDSLSPLLALDRGNVRVFASFLSPGYFASGVGTLSVLEVLPNNSAWLQVRVWDTRLGATYEDVAALGNGGYGESPLFYARGGDPTLVPPGAPGLLIGLQSFSLHPVPEPSSWALLALSAVGFLMTRRRRRR